MYVSLKTYFRIEQIGWLEKINESFKISDLIFTLEGRGRTIKRYKNINN